MKVGKTDPRGFTAHKQAQKGSLDEPFKVAKSLFPLIGERLRRLDRLNNVLISSFCASEDWNDARYRFDRMKAHVEKLTDVQAEQIAVAFDTNDQLHKAIYLINNAKRLVRYMDSATGGAWEIGGKYLFDQKTTEDEDIPFR